MQSSVVLVIAIFLTALCSRGVQAQDTTQVLRLIDRAKEKQQGGQIDSAEYYFKRAGALADQLRFDNGRLSFFGNYSAFLYEQIRYEEALGFAQKALELSLKLDNKPRAAAAYNNIALQCQAQGKLQDAAQNLMKALNISLAIKNPVSKDLSDRRKYYNNLSSLLLDMNDLDKGLHYAWKAYDMAENLKDTLAMGRSLVNVVVAEAMANRLADAEQHALQYLAIGRSYNDAQMELQAHNNLADIYRRQHRYAMALQHYERAQALLPRTQPGNEVYILSGISSVYKDMGKPENANLYFEKALAIAEKELAKPQLIEMYLSGSEIKEAMGAFKEALYLRKRFEEYSDSLRNQETQRTIQELEVKYQTAEHKKSIAERDLKIAEQETEIERKNTWIVTSVSLIMILVSVLFFLRQLSIQKRQTQLAKEERKLLEAQLYGEEKERERTARELHDGVASILSAAKLQIYNAMDRGQESRKVHKEIAQLIELAVKEIRNISHNLAPEAILKEGFAYAIQSFCNRIRLSGFALDCYVIGELPKFEKNTELILYRAIQEAVTNIIKHAEATEAIVQIMGEEGRLLITVEDNGKGFDTKEILATGIGLGNISSRVAILGGILNISSKPGDGTSIYIEIEGEILSMVSSPA